MAGVLGLPARRSQGRGGCRSCSPSPRARPPRSPAPAAAEGRLAWRGPGGARGGRLHRVAPSTSPRLRPGQGSCGSGCPYRGRSCGVGELPPLGRRPRRPRGGRFHRLQALVPGGACLGAPPSWPCYSSLYRPPPRPPSVHPPKRMLSRAPSSRGHYSQKCVSPIPFSRTRGAGAPAL